MRGEPLDQPMLDNALHAVLDRYPTALLFALNAAAVRVPCQPTVCSLSGPSCPAATPPSSTLSWRPTG